jgi:hypothetical protein
VIQRNVGDTPAIGIALNYRYFVIIKKLKTSKLSRLFYDDDEKSIKS